jgi:cytochrome c oxidase cbb3-type subunit 3
VKPNHKEQKHEPKTTGHEWDGIQEYDNPDTLWLRYTFYIAVFFSLGYWVLFPAWPTPNNVGVLGWSSVREVNRDIAEIEKIRKKYQDEFDKSSFEEIMKNPKLLKFALAGGKSVFENNCAQCHGVGGGGNPGGYPNLTTGAWLWGGKLDDLYTTIKYGIRSEHPDTRESIMAAFGKDKILTADQINKVTDYVLSLSSTPDTTSEGHKIFQENCASCHGDKGQGGREFGAPNLSDAVWLYGNDRETIHDVIFNGRGGVMPYWEGKLSDSSIRQVVIYEHQLGGGE